MEERIDDEGAAAATHLVPNDTGTGTATRNEELERHGPIHDAHMGGEYSNHNDHLRDDYVEDKYDNAMNINNTNQIEPSRKQRAWIQKQKQTINEEDAAQHNLQKEQPIQVDDETEVPQSYGCTDIPLPDPERMDDAAAISVMVYLLVIAFLLAMAILIGTVVVSQYGFIVLVAVIIAVGAMLLVFLVVMSVIQGDRKLTKARSQIHKWSMEVKEVIMKEIADLKEDVADYSSGMLLLTYEGELDTTTSDYVRDDFDNKGNKSKRRRKPKSMIFKLAISPLKKLTRKNQKSSNSSGKKRSWFGKKKKTTTVDNDEEGPSANYYVPPSENFEVV